LETYFKPALLTVFLAALLGGAGARVTALEIPVENISTTAGTAVGFVDMEKIFQEFPETEHAKVEYFEDIEKKRLALLDKELEIKNLKDRIDALKKSIDTGTSAAAAGISPSTGTINAVAASAQDAAATLILRQQELDEKEKGLETERLKIEQDLVDEERHRSQAILGHIYVVLQELAEEAQVNVVVDKSSILYGTAQVDLTEKLRERLRSE
jgi:Skp family chaperone for outer membrane proteins